jgi:CRISPR system Cascade subunit CasA
MEAWRSIWDTGFWDTDRVNRYLDDQRQFFDVFDHARPFFQNSDIGFDESKPMSNMVHGMVLGNNASLFDHSIDAYPPSFTPAEASRHLIAMQSFALGGFVSSVKGEDRAKVGSADASPLSRGIVTLVTGKSLFETLMLNLHRYDPGAGVPFRARADDKPAWERKEPTQPIDRDPDGYVDYLTWQSRRIRLQPERNESGVVVRRAAVMKGYQFKHWHPAGNEPMLAYRKVLKPGPGKRPYNVVSFSEAKALWRDSDVLFGSLSERQ